MRLHVNRWRILIYSFSFGYFSSNTSERNTVLFLENDKFVTLAKCSELQNFYIGKPRKQTWRKNIAVNRKATLQTSQVSSEEEWFTASRWLVTLPTSASKLPYQVSTVFNIQWMKGSPSISQQAMLHPMIHTDGRGHSMKSGLML